MMARTNVLMKSWPKDIELYRVVTHYFVAGLIVYEGAVIEAAPIMRWAKGKTLTQVVNWVVHKKKGMVQKI